MHVWGCLSEVRVYNPQEKKLDLMTISDTSLGMLKGLKDICFTIHQMALGLCNQGM